MVAGLSPAYVRRDEPGHPGNWVLYSPVLDPEADRDEAAYTINQSKHRQPDLRQSRPHALFPSDPRPSYVKPNAAQGHTSGVP